MFDNCGGQNKNEMVVRFLMWVVEAGYFPLVQIIFLVKGHTKNACNRMFNLLKLDYHHTNTYTMEQCVENLNKNQHVEVSLMEPEDFFDFKMSIKYKYFLQNYVLQEFFEVTLKIIHHYC